MQTMKRHRTMQTWRHACGVALLLGSVQVHAQVASFDCAKAETPTEKTICNTPSLGVKDVRMATYYQVIQETRPAVSGMVFREFRGDQQQRQAAWLKTRRNACGDRVDCLERAYDERLAALKDVMQKNLGLTYGRMCDGD